MSDLKAQLDREGYLFIRDAIALGPITGLRHLLASLPPELTKQNEHGELSLQIRTLQQPVAVAASLRDKGVLDELIEGRKFMMYPPTLRVQHPGAPEALVPPHQDAGYIKHLTDFFTVWAPLVPIDAKCAGVALYPSLFDPAVCHPTERDGLWLRGLDVGGAPAVEFAMHPGDVLVFHKHMIHASVPNTSDRPRFSIDMRFFGEGVRSPGKHYLDLQTCRVNIDA